MTNCGRCRRCQDRAGIQDPTDTTSLTGMFFRGMTVCVDCGNKRCPKATDHRLDCTNSNEPGQKGSVYEWFATYT